MTKHYTSEKTNYFAYWTLLGVLAFVRALALGRLGKARAIMLALTHAYSGRYDNVSAYPELRAQEQADSALIERSGLRSWPRRALADRRPQAPAAASFFPTHSGQ